MKVEDVLLELRNWGKWTEPKIHRKLVRNKDLSKKGSIKAPKKVIPRPMLKQELIDKLKARGNGQ